MKKLATLVAALSMVGCATTSVEKAPAAAMAAPAAAAPAAAVQAEPDVAGLIAQAEESANKAASVGSEWRDTRKFIDDAKKALEKNDLDTAKKLAKKAKKEGDLGYEQGVAAKNATSWLF